ncbi:MAG: MMPL family transporter [Bdellovibrionales bacterium]|nr:MMPL family transporter [Bdellovibrionales bacterium]
MTSQSNGQRRAFSRALFLLPILGFLSLVFVRTPPVALSPDDLVDRQFETASDLRRLKRDFNLREGLQLIFAKEGGRPLDLREGCAIWDYVSGEPLREPLLSGVNSAFSPREARSSGDARLGTEKIGFARLLEPDCDRAAAEPFDLRPVIDSPWGRSLVGPKGSDLVVELSYDRDFHPEAMSGALRRARENVLAKFPELKLYVGGLHAFRSAMRDGMRGMLLLDFGALALLAVLMRVFFGRWRGIFVLASTLAITFAAVWIGMAFSGVPIDLVNSNLFLMVLIATLEDFVFLSFLKLGGESNEAAFARLRWPAFFTSFTTWIGFTSLAFSNLEIVRRFGVPAGAAAMVEWFVIFFFLPGAIRSFPAFGDWVRAESASFRNATRALSGKRIPRPLAFLLLAAIPGAALVAPHLVYRERPAEIFPAGHFLRESSEYYARTRDSNASGELVFRDATAELSNRAVIEKVRAIPEVSAVEDPYATEAFILRGLSLSDRQAYLSTLRSSPDFAPWLSGRGEMKAHFDVRDPDIAAMNRVRARVEELCPGRECWVAGSFVSYAEFGDKVRQTLVSSLALSLLFVGLVVGFLAWFRGYRREIPVLVGTALWGPAFCCLLVGAFGVPVGIVSCLFAATLTGLTGDNTIQFLFAGRGRDLEESTADVGGASVVVGGMMIGLSLLFLFSPFATARTLGALLALGFAASVLGDLWLLRGLLPTKPAG